MFDLEAYLGRIGLRGEPTIAEVHRAHVASIPFENLDPRRGVPVSLDPDALQHKLVAGGRGGYCFEQNLLLGAALEALGAEVDLILGRVRAGSPPGTVRGRTHLLLRVRAGGREWHADAGFGVGTLLEPIPFGPGDVHDLAGWRFRVVEEDGGVLVLQTESGDGWADVYAFDPVPAPMIDIEMGNWFTATHPRSLFVTGLIVAVQDAAGRRTSLSDWGGELTLSDQTPRGGMRTSVTLAEVPELLATRFGLAGFAIDPQGRIVPADEG